MQLPSFFLHKNLVPLLLRLGLATVFGYAAIGSFLSPDEWVGYLPPMLTNMVDAEMLLRAFSVYELALVIWLLSGWYVRYAALLCALTLLGIVVSNFGLFIISFRDIGLALAALALAVQDYQASRSSTAQ